MVSRASHFPLDSSVPKALTVLTGSVHCPSWITAVLCLFFFLFFLAFPKFSTLLEFSSGYSPTQWPAGVVPYQTCSWGIWKVSTSGFLTTLPSHCLYSRHNSSHLSTHLHPRCSQPMISAHSPRLLLPGLSFYNTPVVGGLYLPGTVANPTAVWSGVNEKSLWPASAQRISCVSCSQTFLWTTSS